MTVKLFLQACIKFFSGVIIIGLLIFLPAGTLRWSAGRLFMGALFIPMLIGGITLMLTNPELLRKRLNADEKEDEQKTVLILSGAMFICGFVLAGLDFRFGWLPLPEWVSVTGAVLLLVGYLLFAEVMRENTYLSRTVEVQENQKVIDTGLYGVVRHPMYMASVLLFWAIPLTLGSVISFAVFLTYPFILAKRIKNEEKVLSDGLEGYTEYMKKVKYRIIPFIW